jgi:hypothetical protein
MSVTFYPSDSGDASPLLNVANGNVEKVLDLLGYAFTNDDYMCGEIACAELSKYFRNVFNAELHGMERESHQVENWYFGGVSQDMLQRYRSTLIEIIGYCMAYNKSLVWG